VELTGTEQGNCVGGDVYSREEKREIRDARRRAALVEEKGDLSIERDGRCCRNFGV